MPLLAPTVLPVSESSSVRTPPEAMSNCFPSGENVLQPPARVGLPVAGTIAARAGTETSFSFSPP